MSYFNDGKNHIVVKRHKMIMCFTILKVMFLFGICFFLFSIHDFLGVADGANSGFFTLTNLAIFLLVLILHYAFYILVTISIKYYNNVIIVGENTITIIKCSLFLKDDIEVIDCFRIVKVDAFTHGFIPNMLVYGDITIEQHKDELRTLRYIPKPYTLMEIIKKQRAGLIKNENT